MKVKLKNDNGIVKEIKVGYSWTSLCFGFFVPLIRGQMSDTIIMLLGIITWGILPIVWTFKINKRYCTMLLEKGYKPLNANDITILTQKGYYISSEIIA